MAWQFPSVLIALAEGRLHVTAVSLLAPYLRAENAEELVGAAAGKSKPEIQELLAQRFPKPDLPTKIELIAPPAEQLSVARVVAANEGSGPALQLPPEGVEVPAPVLQLPPEGIATAGPPPKVAPLSQERYALQVTIPKSTNEKLRYMQELLSLGSADLAELIDRTLDLAIPQAEKRRFAATDKPRPRKGRPTPKGRNVPAEVQRGVWQRDGGQCTFVSDSGKRCAARKHLNFDHILEAARGGKATLENIRLLCRAHNQYQAERTYGPEFMRSKREDARRAAAERRERAAQQRARETAKAQADDIVRGLRNLGFRADDARRAAQSSEITPDASLEDRMRAALAFLTPPRHRPASG